MCRKQENQAGQKNLIFDAGGVMVHPLHADWNLPVRYREILGARADAVTGEAYRRAAAEAAKYLREDVPVSDLDDEFELRYAYLQAIDRAMGWALGGQALLALADDFTCNLTRYVWYGDVDGYLKKWKRRFGIGVLSDAMPSFRKAAAQHDAGRFFSAIVTSTEIGATKPDPRMYRAICARMNVSPQSCLFIDDKPENLCGAQRFGMRAVRMLRDGERDGWDGPRVHNFEELDRLLEEI